MATATELLVWGCFAHLIADWLFQNEWMATNKVMLTHPAAWTHGAIHLIAMLSVFPLVDALSISVFHMIIDTRKPLNWWRRVYRQTNNAASPFFIHVAIWTDQVLHIAVIGFVAWIVSRQTT